MYYSIPGVLRATLNLKDVDYADIKNLTHSDSHPRPSRSHSKLKDDKNKVTRRTRVSFESHPIVLDELEQGFDDLLIIIDMDDFVSMLDAW